MTLSGKPVDPTLGLLLIVAQHLMPLFKIGTIDNAVARQMAVSAIEAYHPETRADYVNIARTIACSITSLALLATTASPDMTPPEKIRTCGRAIALNRAADQSERTMMQRRRHHKANPPSEIPSLMPAPEPPPSEASAPETPAPQPATAKPATAEPPDAAQLDAADVEIQAAIASVMQEYLSVGMATPIPPSIPQRQAPLPKPQANPPYKQELPQNSAILRAGGQTTTARAG